MGGMNRTRLLAMVFVTASLTGMAVFLLSTGPQARAAEPSTGTLQLMQARCDLVETRLSRAVQTETAARVKRGRAYDQELIPYITAFNSRVATHNVDAPELIRIAADLQVAAGPTEFGHLYTVYADDLANAISSDCHENPAETYGWIEKARIDRSAVAEQVQEIDRLIGEYIKELEDLEARFTPAINKPGAETEEPAE